MFLRNLEMSPWDLRMDTGVNNAGRGVKALTKKRNDVLKNTTYIQLEGL